MVSRSSTTPRVTPSSGATRWSSSTSPRPTDRSDLPPSWSVVRDQLALLKVDDFRQRKDAAMTVLMGADIAMRRRNAAYRGNSITRLAVMGG